jgi:hypothetical protein
MRTRSTSKESHADATRPFFSVQRALAPSFFSQSPFAVASQAGPEAVHAEPQAAHVVQRKCSACEGDTRILPQLKVGPVDDPLETEADVMADHVVRRQAADMDDDERQAGSLQAKAKDTHVVQRKCAACEGDRRILPQLEVGPVDDPLETEADVMADHVVRRQAVDMDDDERQAQAKAKDTASSESTTPGLETALADANGSGAPLAPHTRDHMEEAFDADFSGVRVHTGAASATMSEQIGARAFTYGTDIHFNDGEFTPGTEHGTRLLAHELTHVVQQNSGVRRAPKHIQAKRVPETHVVQQDGEQLQRARAQATEGEATGGAPSAQEKGPLNFLSTTDRHKIQRQGARNVIRHRGRWGDIDSPSLLRLWAKEAAMTKLWFGSTVRALQEAPGSAPQLVDAVLPKLRRALASPKEFDGSREARQDADEVLRDQWPMIREPVIEQLVARYTNQLVQALAHTPAGTELETRPDEIRRVRYEPYNQYAIVGYGHILRTPRIAGRPQIYGNREILDIKGCPKPEGCSQGDPEREIWFILKRDANWIYKSTGFLFDRFNWRVFGEVAESTQLAAELFPFLLKLAGFSLGLSSRLAAIVAGAILNALGEQGTRSARGERMQSALEVIKSVGLEVFVGHFTERLFGARPGRALAGDLDQATELAVVRARREVARTDAALIERELRAGKARAVTDPQLASEGYRLEVDIISEGQVHTWRRTTNGGWCRFTSNPLCVGSLSNADEAAKLLPPSFERDLAAAGVSAEARRTLGQQTLSVNDLVARNPARGEVKTGWIYVRKIVRRGGDELRIWRARLYGVLDYIRYHIRAPGLGKESYPIPLAPTWMNHGANDIENFMRARRAEGFDVKFKVTRTTFGPDELRPFYEEMLRVGSPDTLGRLANDQAKVEDFLKEITYEIVLYRRVGPRGQHEVWRATMVAGPPPLGTQVRREVPARVL